MSIYLLINILTITIPFLMSFEKKIKFYKNYPQVFMAILTVGIPFLLWDVFATIRNDWNFNSKYIIGLKIFHLPIEEILFFLTIPFASIFLYETAITYLPTNKIIFPKYVTIIVIAISLLISLLYSNQYYTFTVFIFVALFFLISLLKTDLVLNSNTYWIWILFTYIPFLIVNYILTSMPIVSYSSKAIWGIRFITIPLEDFFYSFSLLSLNLFFYLLYKEKCQKRK